MKRFWALVLILAMVWPGCVGSGDASQRLTLMIYVCGSNLESGYGSASSDIQEMIDAGGAGDGVSVLVMTGGTRYWAMGYDPGECQIQELRRRGMRTVWRSEALNMGSGETLTTLLRYGKENYPAEDYALILWDHGGGPLEGLCWDELFSLDNLTLEELRQGIEGADLGQKLSFIGFDACLMGSLEVAGALEPCADYMIASQETEPAAGWNYSFISGLASDAGPVDTARRIVDGYMEAQVLQGEALTLACLDLSQAPAAVDALGKSFAPRAADMDADSFIKLSDERVKAAAFGQPLKGFGEGGYDLVDLQDLAGRMEAPEALSAALDALVVYSRSNREGAHGVSVYHPCYNKEKYRSKWRGSYKRLGFSEGYARYIDSYGRYLLGNAMTDWSGLEPQAGPLEAGRQAFTLELTPGQAKNLSSARLLVMMSDQHAPDRGGGEYALVGTFPAELNGDTLTAVYDGRALFVEGPETLGPLGYFLGPDGSLVTPVSYVPKEGELRINSKNGLSVLTGDQQEQREYTMGTDTTPNVYFYVADAPEGARIDQVRVRDNVTGTLSNRAAFSEEGYRGMVLWYPLKDLPEANAQGLLPEYSLWDDTAGVNGVTMTLSSDWHFDIRRGGQPGRLLWASFEVTDAQQNTWCTSPMAMENPNLVTVPLAEDAFEAEDVRLSARVIRSDAPSDPGIWLDFDLENLGAPRNFYIHDVVLNGTREVEYMGACYIDPPDGSTGDFVGAGIGSMFIRPKELTGLERVETISFLLRCQEGHETSTQTETRLTLELSDPDVRGIAPEMKALGSCEAAGYAWDVLSISRDWRDMELLLRIENPGAGRGGLRRGWPLVNGSAQLAGHFFMNLPAPGRDVVLKLTLECRNTLRWVGNRFHMGDTYVDIVQYGLPDLTGDGPIREVDLVFENEEGDDWARVPLRLNSPWTPPETLADPDDLWTVFHRLCEDRAEPRTLLDSPEMEVQLDRLIFGLTGVGVLMNVENRTDHAVTLDMTGAEINGRPASVGLYSFDARRFIMPGAGTQVVYCLGSTEEEEEYWATTVDDVAISLSLNGGDPVRVALSAAKGPVKPVLGGTVLEAGELEITP